MWKIFHLWISGCFFCCCRVVFPGHRQAKQHLVMGTIALSYFKTELVHNKMKSLVLLPLQTRNILIGPRNYDVPL